MQLDSAGQLQLVAHNTGPPAAWKVLSGQPSWTTCCTLGYYHRHESAVAAEPTEAFLRLPAEGPGQQLGHLLSRPARAWPAPRAANGPDKFKSFRRPSRLPSRRNRHEETPVGACPRARTSPVLLPAPLLQQVSDLPASGPIDRSIDCQLEISSRNWLGSREFLEKILENSRPHNKLLFTKGPPWNKFAR